MQTNARVRPPDGRSSEPLPPVDDLLWESLTHIQLNIAQTAALCGISVRQLGYWTKQGYVAAQGLGERRMYGLDALRRILGIRRLMADGFSLRQALKSLPLPSEPLPAPTQPILSYTPAATASDVPLPEEVDALEAALMTLFDRNRHVRDSADGLAVKLGRAAVPVRYVAESLCARSVLGKTHVHDEAIYQRLEGTAP
ncbi:MAG: MerR family transcriptional regulator [Armatimonadota bacterium]|nr:MerR family transcriptional regulator [Armatimonadota bacterium]